MSRSRKNEVVVPREEAAFWLDRRGKWHNADGPFENPRIIAYFHSCIRKDQGGFHLAQDHRRFREKVYFPYEDTALFAFDVVKQGDEVSVVLNTGLRTRLRPRRLFIKGEELYMGLGRDAVKFTENALVRVSDLLEFEGGETFVWVRGRRYRVAAAGPGYTGGENERSG
ncbi:MAG: MFS transporter permease [Desulfobacteraceae bacterium]